MKKLILFAAILFAGVSVVKADEPIVQPLNQQTESVELNVMLEAIHSLVINNNASVNLVYKTVEDYEGGVHKDLTDHITVYSTGGFSVNVKANEIFASDASVGVMDLNTIGITVTKGSDAVIAPIEGEKPLSLTAADVISSETGGFKQNYSVKYQGGDKYRDFFKDGKTNIFTTNVVYTLVPN